jgi:hypothetical protein
LGLSRIIPSRRGAWKPAFLLLVVVGPGFWDTGSLGLEIHSGP